MLHDACSVWCRRRGGGPAGSEWTSAVARSPTLSVRHSSRWRVDCYPGPTLDQLHVEKRQSSVPAKGPLQYDPGARRRHGRGNSNVATLRSVIISIIGSLSAHVGKLMPLRRTPHGTQDPGLVVIRPPPPSGSAPWHPSPRRGTVRRRWRHRPRRADLGPSSRRTRMRRRPIGVRASTMTAAGTVRGPVHATRAPARR